MIKLKKNFKYKEVQSKENKKTKTGNRNSAIRPEVVNAKVYKVKRAFVKNAVFITLTTFQLPLSLNQFTYFLKNKNTRIFTFF